MKHELKIKPEYFAAVFFGEKTFEIRNNTDRNFQVGDTLLLKAWDGEFNGDFVEKVVSYITDFEQKPGYVVLGLVNHREHELLEKFHRTGVAIEHAISTGSVLADHPLKSRLELLANHHEREMNLASQLSDATRQCEVMADALLQACIDLTWHHDNHQEEASDSADEAIARINAALVGKLPEQHPDDAAVDRFATAMKAKLAAAREKGRGGWDDPNACSVEFLADLMVAHVGKGNPGNFEDIANLAMMLHQRGADPDVLAGKVPVPAVEVTETIRTAPERIWLQVGDQSHYHSEPFPSDTSEVSWCSDSVVGCEVPYVRADLAATTPEQAKSEKRTVTISGKGLLELVDFTCPDHETDLEQQETEIVLLNREAFISTDGEKMPSGVYVYLAEYPEEGLYGPVGGADPQGGAPCDSASPSSSPD